MGRAAPPRGGPGPVRVPADSGGVEHRSGPGPDRRRGNASGADACCPGGCGCLCAAEVGGGWLRRQPRVSWQRGPGVVRDRRRVDGQPRPDPTRSRQRSSLRAPRITWGGPAVGRSARPARGAAGVVPGARFRWRREETGWQPGDNEGATPPSSLNGQVEDTDRGQQEATATPAGGGRRCRRAHGSP